MSADGQTIFLIELGIEYSHTADLLLKALLWKKKTCSQQWLIKPAADSRESNVEPQGIIMP